MRVAIQGQDGSFHAEAARRYFGPDVQLVECVSFPDVFDAYDSGEADAIITAVENTVYGSINQVYQLIEECPAPITGEIKLPIAQQLIGLPGSNLESITAIYSHPVALAQCRQTLKKILPRAELIEYFDTAGAVEFVRDSADPTIAAIAGNAAAQYFDMAILAKDIHDYEHNITRFLVLDPAGQTPIESCDRCSLLLTTSHEPGSLAQVLQIFSNSNINLAKLQSQPIIGEPWKYKFFIVADTAGTQLKSAIDEISTLGNEVRILGQYRADSQSS